MNTTQLPFLAEGILILTAGIFGILLRRKGKPYGKVKLVVHLFFVLWFSVGFGYIAYGILTMSSATKDIWIPVAIMGLAILTQLVTGIRMLASKKAGITFPKIHLFSAIILVLSDICAFIMAGLRS
jgi:CHASE2 domain-containing sensor protein